MSKSPRTLLAISVLTVSALSIGQPAAAVSPVTIAQGQQLFERNWPARDPSLGGDGLGPLFNGQSCVACHHQGGVGGGGDSRFNAKTIGIEHMRISGPNISDDVIARMVASFHPGFVQPNGSTVNTFTIPHHGGSSPLQHANAAIIAQVSSEFSESGGSTTAAEVRHAYAVPIQFSQRIGNNEIFVRARLFQRNTTSLFGTGVIDAIDDKYIEAEFQAQKRHPEINGRPCTLDDGRLGKFGWRGNLATLIEFVDQACANEVGLETRRKPQGRDPMNRAYRNTSADISDDQIRAMNDFVAALPPPTREIPDSDQDRAMVARGEQVFASVGCAVCHVPNLGPARGLYSDLLLHEMGYESIDLNHAEPYIVRRTPVQKIAFTRITETETTRTAPMGAYYGGTTTINKRSVESNSSLNSSPARSDRSQRNRRPVGGFIFDAPEVPGRLINVINIGRKLLSDTTERSTSERTFGVASVRESKVLQEQKALETRLRIHYQPTKFNEEWRTPPLWGLRDSAPYMHDGRADTVLESISMHDGESAGTRDRFLQLSLADRRAVLAFLDTMVAPPNVPQASL